MIQNIGDSDHTGVCPPELLNLYIVFLYFIPLHPAIPVLHQSTASTKQTIKYIYIRTLLFSDNERYQFPQYDSFNYR